MGTKEIEAVRAFCRFADAAVSATALVHNVVRSAAPDENLRSMIEAGRVVAKIEHGMESCAIATASGPVLVGPQRDGGFLIARIDSTEWWYRTPDGLAGGLYEALVAAGGPLEDEPPVESPEPLDAKRERAEMDAWLLSQGGDALADVIREAEARGLLAVVKDRVDAAWRRFLAGGPATGAKGHDMPFLVPAADETAALGGRELLDGGGVFSAQADLLARETVGILQAAAPVVGWRAFVGAVCVERVDAGWEVTKIGREAALVAVGDWDGLRTEIARLLRGNAEPVTREEQAAAIVKQLEEKTMRAVAGDVVVSVAAGGFWLVRMEADSEREPPRAVVPVGEWDRLRAAILALVEE